MPPAIQSRPHVFSVLWIGQTVSLLGTRLSGFGLGVWIYQQTGSASRFALIALAASLPGLLLGPLAGAVADRKDHRRLMLLGDGCALLSTLVMLLLVLAGRLQAWYLLPLVAWSAVGATFQITAYEAALPLLVPKQHLGRAGGLATLAPALANIAAPALAGLLLGRIGLPGLLAIDSISGFLALAATAMIRLPRRPSPTALDDPELTREGWLAQIGSGWAFVRNRQGLPGLLAYFVLTYAALRFMTVLLTPMVLSFATAAVLGRIVSLGGAGMLAGSLLVSFLGVPRRHLLGILGSGFLLGSGLVLLGLHPSPGLVAAGMVLVLGIFPLLRSSYQTLWRLKVPLNMQGRVYALRTVISDSVEPLVYLSAGPLADRVLGPWMTNGGRLSGWLGPFLGTGPGRGIGLLFLVLGSAVMAATPLAWTSRRLRALEDLPDELGEAPRLAASA